MVADFGLARVLIESNPSSSSHSTLDEVSGTEDSFISPNNSMNSLATSSNDEQCNGVMSDSTIEEHCVTPNGGRGEVLKGQVEVRAVVVRGQGRRAEFYYERSARKDTRLSEVHIGWRRK